MNVIVLNSMIDITLLINNNLTYNKMNKITVKFTDDTKTDAKSIILLPNGIIKVNNTMISPDNIKSIKFKIQ